MLGHDDCWVCDSIKESHMISILQNVSFSKKNNVKMHQKVFLVSDSGTAGMIFHQFVNLVHGLHPTLIDMKIMILFGLMVRSISNSCLV